LIFKRASPTGSPSHLKTNMISRSINRMELAELQTIVDLHKKTYDLLLWLNGQARTRPALLRVAQAESLASTERCVAWLKRHLNDFPVELRPRPDEFQIFGHLFSSFFSTSFKVVETQGWDETVETSLSRGAKSFRGRRHKRYTEGRQERAAEELKRLALTELAEEHAANAIEQALMEPCLAGDLTLWTYGRELIRRTQFVSQGGAVHRLWLALDKDVRKSLSAEAIWRSRERLMQWVETEGRKAGRQEE
jgi:hypothetical protein